MKKKGIIQREQRARLLKIKVNLLKMNVHEDDRDEIRKCEKKLLRRRGLVDRNGRFKKLKCDEHGVRAHIIDAYVKTNGKPTIIYSCGCVENH